MTKIITIQRLRQIMKEGRGRFSHNDNKAHQAWCNNTNSEEEIEVFVVINGILKSKIDNEFSQNFIRNMVNNDSEKVKEVTSILFDFQRREQKFDQKSFDTKLGPYLSREQEFDQESFDTKLGPYLKESQNPNPAVSHRPGAMPLDTLKSIQKNYESSEDREKIAQLIKDCEGTESKEIGIVEVIQFILQCSAEKMPLDSIKKITMEIFDAKKHPEDDKLQEKLKTNLKNFLNSKFSREKCNTEFGQFLKEEYKDPELRPIPSGASALFQTTAAADTSDHIQRQLWKSLGRY